MVGFDLQKDPALLHAAYNESLGRVEISIECLSRQTISIHGTRFTLDRGERIRTEYSHKYTVDGFTGLARQSAFTLQNVWQDRNHLFAVAYLKTDREVDHE